MVNPVWQKPGEREVGTACRQAQSDAAPATVIELNRSPRIESIRPGATAKPAIGFAGRRYGKDVYPLVSPETGQVNP